MIRLGVIGLRNIGRNHIRSAQRLEGVEVVAGADLDPKRCEAAQEEFNLPWTTTQSDELLARDDIDGVVLALPNPLHAPMSIQALEAGKHVLVEKPVCGRSREVEAMMQARDQSGKILMVGHNQRFSPKVFGLREAIRTGKLGQIYQAKTRWNRKNLKGGVSERGAWGFLEKEAGGGPLLDIGIHKLDQLLFLLDFPKPITVSGFISKGIGSEYFKTQGIEYTVEDFATGFIFCEGGLCIQVESSYFHAQKEDEFQETQICGTGGLVDGFETYGMRDGEIEPTEFQPDPNAPQTCAEHFTRVIAGKEELQCTVEEGAHSLQIVEAIYESAKAGQPIPFKGSYL